MRYWRNFTPRCLFSDRKFAWAMANITRSRGMECGIFFENRSEPADGAGIIFILQIKLSDKKLILGNDPFCFAQFKERLAGVGAVGIELAELLELCAAALA